MNTEKARWHWHTEAAEHAVAEAFAPTLRSLFGNVPIDVRAQHVETRDDGAFIMYHAMITPLGVLMHADAERVVYAMDRIAFNSYGVLPTHVVDGKTFVLGDGDDMGACWICGGIVYAWIRHMPDGNY